MTTNQLLQFNFLYLVIFIVVAVLTRPMMLRLAGALAGGLALGPAALISIALGEKAGLWHFAFAWQQPFFLPLLLICFALCGYIFLITWRIARRFGARGLVVALIIAAIIGPPRDYWYMSKFPEWGSYAPGPLPMLAISVTYILVGVLGHGVMRLLAGPAREDRLACRFWKS